MEGVFDLALSADGESLYAVLEDSNGVAVFDRDTGTGVISQRPGTQGCANGGGSEGCAVVANLLDGLGIAMGPEDDTIYAVGFTSDAVVVFDRGNAAMCPTTTTTTTTSTTTTTLPPTACPPVARTGCSVMAGKSRLAIKPSADPSGDSIRFLRKSAEATELADYGDPVGGAAAFDLCLYANAALAGEVSIPEMPVCGSKPCWRAAGKSKFVYADKTASNSGVRNIGLKAGAAGKAKVTLRTLGGPSPFPTLPLTIPVIAQFVVSDAGGERCWQSSFTAARTNKETKFKAVAK